MIMLLLIKDYSSYTRFQYQHVLFKKLGQEPIIFVLSEQR
jgi:hypothetical protein